MIMMIIHFPTYGIQIMQFSEGIYGPHILVSEKEKADD